MTMIMGTVVNGLTYAWTRGQPFMQIPPTLAKVGERAVGPFCVLVFCALGLIIAIEYMFRRRRFGRSLYLIGSNRQAAALAGINQRRNIIGAYTLGSVIASTGGILLIGYVAVGNIQMAENYTMLSIAALAIGGANMMGGRGTAIGSALGAIVLIILSSVLVAAGLNAGVRQFIEGLLLILILIAIFSKNAKKLQQ